nr:reverse transcriptase domain-containing protein [Tanacetum cinerariifolium]
TRDVCLSWGEVEEGWNGGEVGEKRGDVTEKEEKRKAGISGLNATVSAKLAGKKTLLLQVWDFDNIFSRKLKTRWTEPFTITLVFPYGTIELSQPDGPNFKVNGHRVKHYFGRDISQLVVPDLQTFHMDQ